MLFGAKAIYNKIKLIVYLSDYNFSKLLYFYCSCSILTTAYSPVTYHKLLLTCCPSSMTAPVLLKASVESDSLLDHCATSVSVTQLVLS